MTALLSCQDIEKSYGGRCLLHDVSFAIHKGERVGVIGPNGSGKSTFLKILAGVVDPDAGRVTSRRGITVAYIPQHPEFPDLPLEEILLEVAENAELPGDYDAMTRVQITLGKLGFEDSQQRASQLSGGWLKRLAIARELVQDPDLLLLDEPTNHLDLESILWLEAFLGRADFAFMVISHDRRFLEAVSQRILEVNPRFPEGIFSVDGPYSLFLEKRETFLEGQQRQEQRLQSKLRREIEWLRRSPKARTTKSQSRVDEAYRLQDRFSEVKARNVEKSGQIGFAGTERQTKKLMTGKNLSKTLGERALFEKVDIELSPGTRLAIVGPNGSGKSTLLKILSKQLESDSGTLKMAEGLQMVIFDQQRRELPQDISLREALSPNGDTIRYQGSSIHVNAWCQRFLFTPERLDLPVNRLSGGEQARVLIARLMLQPADILFLDEPTNDLDIPTLELLEDSLLSFPGAVVFISHDRLMVDQVSTELIAVGPGVSGRAFADRYQYEAALADWEEAQKSAKEKKVAPPGPEKKKKAKLSYKEKRELEGMEERILGLEEQIASLEEQVNDPAVAADAEKLQEACRQLEAAQGALENSYVRWEELEERSS